LILRKPCTFCKELYWNKVSQDVEKSQKANEEWAAEQQAEKSTSKEGARTQGDNGQGKSEGAK